MAGDADYRSRGGQPARLASPVRRVNSETGAVETAGYRREMGGGRIAYTRQNGTEAGVGGRANYGNNMRTLGARAANRLRRANAL